MRCPICKNVFLGPITLVDGLPARQCSNCKGVSISSNVYLTWRRTLGQEFPPKEGALEIDPSWEVKELKLCPDSFSLCAPCYYVSGIQMYMELYCHFLNHDAGRRL